MSMSNEREHEHLEADSLRSECGCSIVTEGPWSGRVKGLQTAWSHHCWSGDQALTPTNAAHLRRISYSIQTPHRCLLLAA